MVKVKCKYCGKEKCVNPSNIKDVDDYHCKDCHPLYLKDLYATREGRQKMSRDWSQLRMLNNLGGGTNPSKSRINVIK